MLNNPRKVNLCLQEFIMNKILMTGFCPFDNHLINPSEVFVSNFATSNFGSKIDMTFLNES